MHPASSLLHQLDFHHTPTKTSVSPLSRAGSFQTLIMLHHRESVMQYACHLSDPIPLSHLPLAATSASSSWAFTLRSSPSVLRPTSSSSTVSSPTATPSQLILVALAISEGTVAIAIAFLVGHLLPRGMWRWAADDAGSVSGTILRSRSRTGSPDPGRSSGGRAAAMRVVHPWRPMSCL